MKYIRIIARIILGSVFIFSGFVKGIDPMGSAIKFTEYFEAFHMSWLGEASLVFSILLSTAELLIGICLLIGLRMKVTTWAAFLFMGFFTLLTLFSAIVNPVSDCGCFGDALVLTNWQTFFKNIFLFALAFLIFKQRNKYIPYGKPITEWGIILLFAFMGLGIFLYCYNHLPIIDFRPYNTGTHIPSKMVVPEGSPKDEYKTRLYYQKDGITKEFTLQNYPWRDTSWKWVNTISDLIKKGYSPPIHGFSITSEGNEDITNQVLTDTGYSFIFISYDISLINPEIWKKINDYYKFANTNNHRFYFLTSSATDISRNTKTLYNLQFDFLYSDQTVLKTIIRSNPGLMLLKDGVILGLWHYNDFPATGYFKGNILSKIITKYNHKEEGTKVILLTVVFLLMVYVLLLARKKDER